ncbi:hypothetical protein KC19_6G067500 [Ceratodon purpureus]|uniref:Uncharacterized protein n=1 Tax=Ceratodon purpureus TaxID=3225 RepID=A0A8T0HF85_CERPU|nr:hypothetical protein KC19_6G067500 [Ceratodon purpureus]
MRSEEVDVGGMSDADHLVHGQSLQLHHSIHQHSLSHGLGHAQHAMHEMHVHGHGDADGQARVDQRVQGHLEGEHVHDHHGHHGHGMHSNEENGAGGEDHDDDAGDEEGLDEADMHSDGGGNQSDQPAALAVRTQGSTQLTLSYQGEVYVFDTVPPEKVQAVLLLLGGREIPPGMSGVNVSSNHHHKGMPELPARMNMPQRLASLTRFREKRKERCYDKRIRYTVRKEVAQRMQRKKGQFASSRPTQEEGAVVPNWDGTQAPGQPLGPGGVQPEVTCVHCGIGERSTPMMRRGPAGPRTLCNACGLMWANKGVLRDLSKNIPIAPGGQQQLMLHPQQIIQHQHQQHQQHQVAGLQHSVENAPEVGDVQGSQQREVDVQKNMASMVAAGGGSVLAAG